MVATKMLNDPFPLLAPRRAVDDDKKKLKTFKKEDSTGVKPHNYTRSAYCSGNNLDGKSLYYNTKLGAIKNIR
jgi:hypothetical protein